jgi:predicted nucleic acid-binding protein
MLFLVDTDVLIDVSRANPAAIRSIDRLGNDWALSTMTALELIAGAKNLREVELIDNLIESYEVIPVTEVIGKYAYDLLKIYAKSDGLRSFDALIAATAIEEHRTLVTRNQKHFRMISGLAIEIPNYLVSLEWLSSRGDRNA